MSVFGYDDPSPLGGAVSFIETSRGLAVAGRRLVVEAILSDASSREALLSYPLGSPSGAFTDGTAAFP